MIDWPYDEWSFVSHLMGFSNGTKGLALISFHFFTLDSFNYDVSDIWYPSQREIEDEPLYFSNIHDAPLKNMFEQYSIEREKLIQLNMQWTKMLLQFLHLPFPKHLREWDEFRQQIDEHRAKHGASWMELSKSQWLATEMQQLITIINEQNSKINKRMVKVYSDLIITDEDFGDQRAKDLIDMTEGIPDSHPEEAIKLLNEALTYGETGIQASKAYLGLGMRYEDLNEIDTAIENYTKSLEADKPFSICLFWRGKLYFQQGKWLEAESDFEQALELGELVSPEVEQAQNYLNQIQQNKKS